MFGKKEVYTQYKKNIFILFAEGEAHIISLVSYTIVHRYRFKRKIHAVKFSPDGKHFAVCKEKNGKCFNFYCINSNS